MNGEKSYISVLIGWVFRICIPMIITGSLLYIVLRGLDWERAIVTASQANPGWLLATCGVYSIALLARGIRWGIILSAEQRISPVVLFNATTIGYLGNAFLPARLGELGRTVTVQRATDLPLVFVLTTVFTERILDACFLSFISLILIAQLGGTPEWLTEATRIMTGAGLFFIVFLFFIPRLQSLLARLIQRLPLSETVQELIDNIIEKLVRAIRVLYDARRMLGFGAMTILVWTIDTVMALCLSQAFELQLSTSSVILLLAALGLSSAIPSTPGYLGVYQFVAVSVLNYFDTTRSDALVYIFALQGVIYGMLIIWGIPSIWWSRQYLPSWQMLRESLFNHRQD